MVARAEAIQARTPRRHAPLAITAKGIWIMKPILARVAHLWCRWMHAEPMWPSHGRYECRKCGRRHLVGWEQPLAVPLRTPVLPLRRPGPGRLGCGDRIEDPMFVATTLAVLVLLSLILSMVPSPGLAARVRESRLPAPAPLPVVA
jgi:hypothetical protein